MRSLAPILKNLTERRERPFSHALVNASAAAYVHEAVLAYSNVVTTFDMSLHAGFGIDIGDDVIGVARPFDLIVIDTAFSGHEYPWSLLQELGELMKFDERMVLGALSMDQARQGRLSYHNGQLVGYDEPTMRTVASYGHLSLVDWYQNDPYTSSWSVLRHG